MDNNTTTTNNNSNANFRLSISIMSHGSYTLGRGSHFGQKGQRVMTHDSVNMTRCLLWCPVYSDTCSRRPIRCVALVFWRKLPGTSRICECVERYLRTSRHQTSPSRARCLLGTERVRRRHTDCTLAPHSIYTHVRYATATGIDKRQVDNNGHNTGNVVH